MKRKLFTQAIFAATAIILSLLSVLTVSAEEKTTTEVKVSGRSLPRGSEIRESTTCVSFRDFFDAMTDGEAVISWDGESRTAKAEWRGVTITAKVGEPYIVANGRYIMCGYPSYIEGGRTMTAVRPLAKVFGSYVIWNAETKSVEVGSFKRLLESGDTYYDADELYWLSRIISAESRGEPLYGRLAVGAVVYNRVENEYYPDTVYDVIFDMKNGVQFTPAKTGSVYETPTEGAVIAAKLCMEGYRYRSDILFFCTTEIMTTCWAGQNRKYIETIGGHAFFA